MKTKIEITIEGPDGQLIANVRDELEKILNRKISQWLRLYLVKKTNTAFSVQTESVHE